jgi:TRAP-type mannitol/chloroaromatic compound transport system substrate-binding protein
MKRRDFIQSAAAGVAGGLVASPAIAQSSPDIRWRLSSGFPKSLDTLFGASELLSKYVAEATDGRFQIQPFASGEIVGTAQAFDAVGNATIEIAHTCSYYYVGKDLTFAIGTAIPFGLNSRQMNAWLYHGGGNDLLNEFYAKYNVYGLPGGNTGAQMGGWFRKEIKSLQDLQGIKFRIPGLAGQLMAKLGAVPQQIAGGDLYPALERGTIDAAEWVAPYDDEKLGFYRVAPFYYYPGFWEGGPTIHFYINLQKWQELPKQYQAALQAAAAYANIDIQAKYDAVNPPALRRLVANGAQLRPFSQDIMEAGYKAANEIYDELSANNAAFKKIFDSYRAFRNEEYLWFQVAEYTYDNFMIRARARG